MIVCTPTARVIFGSTDRCQITDYRKCAVLPTICVTHSIASDDYGAIGAYVIGIERSERDHAVAATPAISLGTRVPHNEATVR